MACAAPGAYHCLGLVLVQRSGRSRRTRGGVCAHARDRTLNALCWLMVTLSFGVRLKAGPELMDHARVDLKEVRIQW